MTQKRIAILTGGGDVPGLNSVIKSVVYRATEMGYEAIGVRRGWEGLTHLTVGSEEDSHYIRHLDRTNTRTIDRTGGTILHTSRTNPRKMRPRRDARRDPPFALAVAGGRGGDLRRDARRPREPRGARHRGPRHDRR